MEVAVENLSRRAHAGNRTEDRKSAILPSVHAYPELADYGVPQEAEFQTFLPRSGVARIAMESTPDTPIDTPQRCQLEYSQHLEKQRVVRSDLQLTPLTPHFSSVENTHFRDPPASTGPALAAT